MKKSGKFVLFASILIILTINLVYAENLNLKITGNLNNLTSDLILKTSASSLSGIDSYDMRAANVLLPDTYSQFYTTSTGTNLVIDSWDGTLPRTINVTYHTDSSQSGNVNFSWPIMTGTYDASFVYYGADSSYTTPVNTIGMRNYSNYTASVSGVSNVYMQVLITTYTEPQTPSTPGTGTTSPGGGGGGGGAEIKLPKLSELTAVPTSLNLPATIGVTTTAKISLTNNGQVPLEVETKISNIDKIMKTDSELFSLQAGETKIIEFTIYSNQSDIYAGKIKFKSQGKEIEIPVSINMKSESSLFDISLDLGKSLINAGKKILGQITLIQAGLQEKIDVTMSYVIKDFDGNTYYQKSETIAVEKQKSYEYEFPTQDLPPGDYLIGTEVIYSGGIATASSQFKVQEKSSNYWFLIILAFIVLSILIVIAWRYRISVSKFKNKKTGK